MPACATRTRSAGQSGSPALVPSARPFQPRRNRITKPSELKLTSESVHPLAGITHRDACREAMALLPDLARHLPPTDVGRDLYAVVRDEAGREFFRATLSLEGAWLD
ncbi:DUF6894 family protein [Roseomonas sp. BN140053]|uniref:DUF6894 family protein n=1 Tax=Roseomonas sp. BN140053 TaxID=3391898 RepID=UPI0039E95A5F